MTGRTPLLTRRAALLGAVAVVSGPERAPLSARPLARMDTPWWRERHAAKLEELRSRPVDLIWLGDSITQSWEMAGPPEWRDFAPVWQRFYGDRNAVNLGFKGDNTAHLLWRMQNGSLDGIAPKAAVVLIGANNMGRVRWTALQTVAGINAVMGELARRLPMTKVLLLGVLPSLRSPWATRTTDEVNRELARLYPPGGPVRFMDLAPLFMRDGEVDRTQFYDDLLSPRDPPLHPTAQAQARMAEAIEPVLAAMLGDRSRVRQAAWEHGAARQD